MTRWWSAAALCATLFLLVLTAFVPERWPVSVLECGAFGLALGWTIRLAIAVRPPRLHWILAPLVFVPVWAALQLALHRTVAAADTERTLLTWSAYLACAFIALQTFEQSGPLEWFLQALFLFGAALCVLAILQAFTSPSRVFWIFPVQDPIFLMGPFLYHTHYANFVELLLPLALIPALQDPSKRVRYCLLAAVMVASVIASASRGGFVLIAIEIVAALLLGARGERGSLRRVAPVFATFVVLAAGLTWIVGWETLAKRFVNDPYYGRGEMFNSSLDMMRDHPLAGAGMGAWPEAYPSYARYDDGFFANTAHNDWAQWTAEGGMLVFVAMLGLAACAVFEARRHPWCLGVVFVLIHASFDYPFQKPAIAALAIVMLAASCAQRSKALASYASIP